MTEVLKSKEMGRRIAAWRKLKGFSQVTVSRRTGIDSTYLSRIETGKIQPSVRMVLRIASGLRMSPSELLELSPAKRKQKPCPVSPSGHCLMDLLDMGSDAAVGRTEKKFTPRQLRLIRRFTGIVQEGDQSLVKALEVLLGNIGKDSG